jgi:hypothetical protein
MLIDVLLQNQSQVFVPYPLDLLVYVRQKTASQLYHHFTQLLLGF